MSRIITREKPAAFDLEIAGSIGSFAVKTDEGSSIPVQYIQTHIKFALDDPHQQRLFDCLKPVREIFNERDLGFEDLMQRDIDDARVSTQLIPYLLLPASGDTVKFFPPIVTVVVPVDAEAKLLRRYPNITTVDSPVPQQDYSIRKICSGPAGQETFQFEQTLMDGELNAYDYARLKLNTNKCQLVIVDGQHRAMALLALYRNIRKWPEGAGAFASYYKRWTTDHLKNNLSEISLPMVICTFPTLDEKSDLHISVSKGCRQVFLALNKNARPVSNSRNILLDDEDFMAHCERAILEKIKNEPIDSPNAVRLFNFELDADEDRHSLKSTLAISGVMHLFSALERVLLSDEPSGLNFPGRKYTKISRVKFEGSCLRRLNAQNLIGSERSQATDRYTMAHDVRTALKESFEKRYGKYFKQLLQEFAPYESAGRAAQDLEKSIDEKEDTLVKKMLFEGQGIQKVFNAYMRDFGAEVAERYGKAMPAAFQSIIENFKQTDIRLQKFQKEYFKKRMEKLLTKLASKLESNPNLQEEIDTLYRYGLTTVAFQNALFITFFSTVEKLNGGLMTGEDADDAIFADYLNSINQFFKPTKEDELSRLLNAFSGKVSGQLSEGNYKIVKTNSNLKSILLKGAELKPDEWDKFRYMLLEIWRKNRKLQNAALENLLDEYVGRCRKEALAAYVSRETNIFCRNSSIDITEIPAADKDRIKKECLENFVLALADIGVKVIKDERKQLEESLEESALFTEEPENVDEDSEDSD